MNDLILNQNANGGVITLKEITDLLEVRHDKAMLKIETLSKEPSFGVMSKMDTINLNGLKVKTYLLNKKQAIAVGARLNNSLLMKLIDKLEEIEHKNAISLPQTYKEALIALIAKEEQLEEAIKTKAYISDKKTATALNRASQEVKRANKLERELDKSKEYCTIKRMEMLNHGQKFNWRLLKSTGSEMGIETIEIFDANYGTVKSYHRDVWLETYGLEF